ncbi:hypothetical protein BB561_002921 [Smittium simulii]|uniref:Reverse transcriptase zinc-binding domain-containing protein n=1 Tax=Smittium simulii TaxID=133385 RepID=A0A2T9YNQ2_9FUNG|nr:hypothetical protein BB561_002921 [Smittium simulii]
MSSLNEGAKQQAARYSAAVKTGLAPVTSYQAKKKLSSTTATYKKKPAVTPAGIPPVKLSLTSTEESAKIPINEADIKPEEAHSARVDTNTEINSALYVYKKQTKTKKTAFGWRSGKQEFSELTGGFWRHTIEFLEKFKGRSDSFTKSIENWTGEKKLSLPISDINKIFKIVSFTEGFISKCKKYIIHTIREVLGNTEKSGQKKQKKIYKQKKWNIPDNFGLDEINWKKSYNLGITPKIRSYLWLLFNGALRTSASMRSYIDPNKLQCPFCDFKVEDLDH